MDSLELTDNEEKALDLRHKAFLTFREIGLVFGKSTTWAHRFVSDAEATRNRIEVWQRRRQAERAAREREEAENIAEIAKQAQSRSDWIEKEQGRSREMAPAWTNYPPVQLAKADATYAALRSFGQ